MIQILSIMYFFQIGLNQPKYECMVKKGDNFPTAYCRNRGEELIAKIHTYHVCHCKDELDAKKNYVNVTKLYYHIDDEHWIVFLIFDAFIGSILM